MERRHDAACLHRHRHVAVLLDVALDDVRGGGEHLVEIGGERHERHLHHGVGLEAPARVHDVVGVGARLRVVDDGLLRVVVDLDHLARVLGEVAGLGDDDGDRVAHVAHVGDRERRRHRELLAHHRVVAGPGDPVEVLPREHRDHARHLAGGADVDAGDRGAGEVAAEERGVQRAGDLHVVDVEAVTGEEALVLLARDGLADEARGEGRSGRGGHDAESTPTRAPAAWGSCSNISRFAYAREGQLRDVRWEVRSVRGWCRCRGRRRSTS